jgi:hypothetical protein
MATQDAGQVAMETLERQWYNTIVEGLGLDRGMFQLLRPTTPLGATSDTLWVYFDNIPPLSLANNFAASGGNNFYKDYRAVVGQLVTPSTIEFEEIIGDSKAAWEAYVEKLPPLPNIEEELAKIFSEWAFRHGHADIAAAGATALESFANNGILRAQRAVKDEKAFLNGIPNYSGTIAALRGAIARSEGPSILFDSASAQTKAESAWARGSVSGLIDFFNGGGSASFAQMSAHAASSHIVAKVNFKHALTFSSTPGGWYSSAALGAAYATADNTVWKPSGTPNWESTFGSKGNMPRFTASLIVVDGIEMTLESDAAFSSAQRQEIEAHASVGFWPFFSAHAAGGMSSSASFDSEGRMTVKNTNPAGNPVVFGANVLSAAAYLASQK